jgi:hypothetical protein
MTYGLIYKAPKLKTVEIATGLLYILPKIGDLIKTLLVEATPKQAFDELGPGFEGATQYSIKTQSLSDRKT